MNDNLTNQQPKAGPKWQAITSLVLGGISILADANIVITYSGILNGLLGGVYTEITGTICSILFLSSLFGGWLFAMVGLIFGIMGLKYTKRKLAIAGIILSVIGFVAYVYLYFMAVRIGTG
ncbi:MAG: hypothetical protein JXB43_08310 [Dehalococcoidia bacterium]|nr:hypothetical protein [Dehalococcoidia bacterium]